MKGTEGIIDKILSDARAQAQKTIEVAEYDSAMAKKATADWEENYFQRHRKALSRECEEVVERKLTLAKLDKRKLILKTKQQIVDKVFESALNILQTLKKADYLKLVLKLIEKNADNGDTIVLSLDGVINGDDLLKSSIVADKKLTVAKKKGNFTGGVMLVGSACDKDLTFSALLEENREQIVNKINSELFC